MKRFNIAYIPKYNSKNFVNLSEKFDPKCYSYQLGENSLPHITICQFMADEDKISQIWSEVCSKISNNSIHLAFSSFSNVSFDKEIFWISIIPAPIQPLVETFHIVSKIVKPIRNDTFDPHLTLFNYLPGIINITSEENLNIDEEFELILGESDDIGQLKNITYHFENQFTSSFLL